MMPRVLLRLMLTIGALTAAFTTRHHQKGLQPYETTAEWENGGRPFIEAIGDPDGTSGKLDLRSNINKLYVEKLLSDSRLKGIERSPYLFKRNINPRSSSYITLCHFKICNMGKRSRLGLQQG